MRKTGYGQERTGAAMPAITGIVLYTLFLSAPYFLLPERAPGGSGQDKFPAVFPGSRPATGPEPVCPSVYRPSQRRRFTVFRVLFRRYIQIFQRGELYRGGPLRGAGSEAGQQPRGQIGGPGSVFCRKRLHRAAPVCKQHRVRIREACRVVGQLAADDDHCFSRFVHRGDDSVKDMGGEAVVCCRIHAGQAVNTVNQDDMIRAIRGLNGISSQACSSS